MACVPTTERSFAVRTSRDHQSLSYPLRLPDEIQADALRLLDMSREVINLVVSARWRCEAEQVGRMLRSQAKRKQKFTLILPLLSQGMILPKTDTNRAGKNRKAIKRALADLRDSSSDGGNAVELQSLIEQACNFYLHHGCFPTTYEEMQAVPVLQTGVLPYAGDDGPVMGQTYRMSLDLEQMTLRLSLQMFPRRSPSRMAAAPPDFACVPTLWNFCQYVWLARASRQERRLGSLALLLQPCLPLEWLQRLCRFGQHRPHGRSLDSPCTQYRTGNSSWNH